MQKNSKYNQETVKCGSHTNTNRKQSDDVELHIGKTALQLAKEHGYVQHDKVVAL
jgi:hypothetical protein